MLAWNGLIIESVFNQSCPSCGARSAWKKKYKKQMTADNFSPWSFFECESCGHREVYNQRGEIRIPGRHCNSEIWALFEKDENHIMPMLKDQMR
jgi:DNA-directed RNA polymerase subunit RPC12/RpoP